jgi:hypothetical protein
MCINIAFWLRFASVLFSWTRAMGAKLPPKLRKGKINWRKRLVPILSCRILRKKASGRCCGTVTIFYGSGSDSGSDFWQVKVPVLHHWKRVRMKWMQTPLPTTLTEPTMYVESVRLFLRTFFRLCVDVRPVLTGKLSSSKELIRMTFLKTRVSLRLQSPEVNQWVEI